MFHKNKIILVRRMRSICGGVLFLGLILIPLSVDAQENKRQLNEWQLNEWQEDKRQENGSQWGDRAIATNGFFDNWYLDYGIDMNLLFPSRHKVSDVFPNGKSFGINVAAGKWFSPVFGERLKLTWNNGILKNDYNTWLRPYGEPGGNRENGGFITFLGDIELNLHNLFGEYKSDRMWNAIFTTHAGGWIDIGSGSGAHVLGVGLINTIRVNEKWSIVADAGYHFVSSINGVRSGTGHGGNGFAEIGIGLEMGLGYGEFHYADEHVRHYEHAVATNSFWDNWFLQAGAGLSLQNPYGTNFLYVIPRGSTVGINLALGKWFTPEIGVRDGINWQNGIIGNSKASQLDARDQPGSNAAKHGFIVNYCDAFINLHNIIGGYNDVRKWNAIVYHRMGLCMNFSSEFAECPLVGVGTEHTYKINDRIKLYADLAYQVVTGGFLDGKFPTGEGADSNGWFDIFLGVQFELGPKCGSWRQL